MFGKLKPHHLVGLLGVIWVVASLIVGINDIQNAPKTNQQQTATKK